MKRRNADMFYLEQELLGELSDRNKTAEIPDSSLILEELRESDREILSSYPPEMWASSLKRKTGLKSRTAWISLAAAAALAMMVTVNLNNNPAGNLSGNEMKQEVTRIKGQQEVLTVFREEGDKARKLEEGSKASEGDLLQLKYSPPEEARYGFIFSIDGAGTLTQHLPLYGSRAKELEPGKSETLPYAYELDNAPHFETFYFITGQGEFNISELIEALEKADGEVEDTVKQNHPELNLYHLSLIKENRK